MSEVYKKYQEVASELERLDFSMRLESKSDDMIYLTVSKHDRLATLEIYEHKGKVYIDMTRECTIEHSETDEINDICEIESVVENTRLFLDGKRLGTE